MNKISKFRRKPGDDRTATLYVDLIDEQNHREPYYQPFIPNRTSGNRKNSQVQSIDSISLMTTCNTSSDSDSIDHISEPIRPPPAPRARPKVTLMTDIVLQYHILVVGTELKATSDNNEYNDTSRSFFIINEYTYR